MTLEGLLFDDVSAEIVAVLENASQLAQRVYLDLAHAFARHTEFEPGFFEGASRVIAQTETA